MRVLFVIPEDIKGERRGGVTTYTTVLARQLSKLGHQVAVLTPGDTNEQYKEYGYTITRISHLVSSNRLLVAILTGPLRLLSKVFPETANTLHWMLQVYFFVRSQNGYDLVECPDWGGSCMFVSMFLKREVVVARLHRSWRMYVTDNDLPITIDNNIVGLLELYALQKASAISSPTTFLANNSGLPAKVIQRISVIPYGFPMMEAGRSKKMYRARGYILFVGRLERAKGCLTLIKSYQLLSDARNVPDLILVGEDTYMYHEGKLQSYKGVLEDYIQSHGLEKQVKIVGKKRNAELQKMYQECSVCVVPSEGSENMPYVILEAMSHGVPIIASRAGGIPEIISHRKNGLLFVPGDHKGLMKQMYEFYRDKKLASRFSHELLHDRMTFDIKVIAPRMLDYYSSLIRKY